MKTRSRRPSAPRRRSRGAHPVPPPAPYPAVPPDVQAYLDRVQHELADARDELAGHRPPCPEDGLLVAVARLLESGRRG